MTQDHWVSKKPSRVYKGINFMVLFDLNDRCGALLVIQIQIYLMSGQDSSQQSLSSGNVPQAQQAPQQHSPFFYEGQALFGRLRANRIQEYTNFQKLDTAQMAAQIDTLQFWINRGGPQNQLETSSSKVLLKRLKEYRSQELQRKMQYGFLGNWISNLYQRLQPQLKFSNQKKSVQYGLGSSSQQSFGKLKKLSIGADETESEEMKPLKQQ